MKSISYQLAKETPDRIGSGFAATDITLDTEAANVAEIALTDRYPLTGFAKNRECEMIVRILRGEVIFWCNGKNERLPEGATVLVPKGARYFWLPQPQVRLLTFSTPPWTKEQYDMDA